MEIKNIELEMKIVSIFFFQKIRGNIKKFLKEIW